MVSYLVSLSEAEVVAEFLALPEVAKSGGLVLVRTRGGFDLVRTRKHPPFEDEELAPLRLRVALTRRPRGTLVTAWTASPLRWGALARAIVGGLLMFPGTAIAGALVLREVLERRRRERSDLLNLVARVLGEHARMESDAPYRG